MHTAFCILPSLRYQCQAENFRLSLLKDPSHTIPHHPTPSHTIPHHMLSTHLPTQAPQDTSGLGADEARMSWHFQLTILNNIDSSCTIWDPGGARLSRLRMSGGASGSFRSAKFAFASANQGGNPGVEEASTVSWRSCSSEIRSFIAGLCSSLKMGRDGKFA